MGLEATGGFSIVGEEVTASSGAKFSGPMRIRYEGAGFVDDSSSSSNHASSSSSSCRGSRRKRPASMLPYRMPWLGGEGAGEKY